MNPPIAFVARPSDRVVAPDPTLVAAEVTRVRRFRRRVTAASYLGAGVALFGSEVADPSRTGKPAELARLAIDSSERMVAGAVLLTVSSALLVVGALGSARLVRGRGRRLVHVGAGMSVLGAMGHMAYATFVLILTALPATAADRSELQMLVERIDGSTAVNAVVLPLILSFALGMLVLQVGLVRGRVVPGWVLAPVTAAILIEVAHLGTTAAALAKQSLALAAVAVVAASVWRLSDRDWAEPPFVPTRRMLRG